MDMFLYHQMFEGYNSDLEDTGIEELVYLSFIGLVYSKSRNRKLPTSFTCAV